MQLFAYWRGGDAASLALVRVDEPSNDIDHILIAPAVEDYYIAASQAYDACMRFVDVEVRSDQQWLLNMTFLGDMQITEGSLGGNNLRPIGPTR